MCNLRPDDLVPGVQLKRGGLRRKWCQMKSFDGSFDAVLLVGYHAKAGSSDAILAHTWITGFRDVRVNGASVPEPSLNAYLAGAFGVPVVMLSGDDRVISEAHPVLGDFGVYQSVMELAPGWEVFTPSADATPTLGSAGATTTSPTVILKTYVAAEADRETVDAALAAIMAAHPWETPVVELTDATLPTR